MAGPFGIEQVDVPGVMGGVANMQFNRIRAMMAQKQLEMVERQSNALQAVANAYSGQNAAPSGSSSDTAASSAPSLPASTAAQINAPAAAMAATAPSAAPGAPNAPATPPASSAMPPAQSYIPSDAELARRRAAAAAVSTFSPEMAGQMLENFGKMDSQQLAAVQQRNARIAQLEAGILQLPYAQRKAAIQASAADFQQMGYNPQQLASFDPTDENVRGEIAKHLDVDHLMTMVQPHFENMRAGGAVSETTPSGVSTVVAQSPIINGPKGAIYGVPGSVAGNIPTVQTPQDAAKLPPGTQFKLPDGRIGTVPGGAGGNASGGFQ